MFERGLRVLMTTDAVGGVFSYTRTLARELSKRGVELAIATMGPAMRVEQRAALRSIPRVVVHESTFALEWEDDPWQDVERAGRWLLGLERRFHPDVIHLNGYAHGALPFDAKTIVVAHSCVLSWWDAVFGEPAPPRYDVYRRAVRDGLLAAQLVIAPTRAMHRALERHYMRLPAARVIPNGASVRAVTADKEPFVLAAGRMWDRAKNVDALARVAPRISWPVKVAGTDALANVEALGWLDASALSAQMARASVFVLPARYEPFGLSALEAALHGCALVLGDIESLREVWQDAALFVPPDDDEALASALDTLIRDRKARLDLAARAKRRAATFTPAATAQATLDAYACALGQGAASCA